MGEALPFVLASLAGGAQGAASGLANSNIEPQSFVTPGGSLGENFFLEDPRGLIQSATRGATNIGTGFADLVNSPVTLPSAFAQPLPTFRGGGLPFDIGVSAVDPALFDPSLLGIPGVNIGRNPFQDDPNNPNLGVNDPNQVLAGGAGRGIGAIPDLAQATGAAQLLMEAANLGNVDRTNPQNPGGPGNTGDPTRTPGVPDIQNPITSNRRR